jgi:isopentenyldiphosphate isomerase
VPFGSYEQKSGYAGHSTTPETGMVIFMEIWTMYDRYRQPTGRTINRGEEIEPGDYHLVVHVCIFNSRDELLIQQRQPFKKGWSNMWDVTVGGSAVAGDNSQAAAEREVYEEIGYKLSLEGVSPHMTVTTDNVFDDIYIVRQDVDINSLALQYEEVRQVKWAACEDIINMINSGEFIPYSKGYIRLLFDMNKRRGLID